MYVGSNHDIGSHTTLEGAKAALDQRMKDGSIRRKRAASKSGLRVGRVSQLGNATRVVQGKSCAEVMKRWRFLVEYGEPPVHKRRRSVSTLAQSCYPDDALSSADHSKTSKELYTMEPSPQPLNLQLEYRHVKDVFVKVARRRLK